MQSVTPYAMNFVESVDNGLGRYSFVESVDNGLGQYNFTDDISVSRLGRIGASTTGVDFTPSWQSVVNMMSEIASGLSTAENSLLNSYAACQASDEANYPDGSQTPLQDQNDDYLAQIESAISTYNSIASAVNSASSLIGATQLPLAGLNGIFSDTIGTWSLSAILVACGPIAALIQQCVSFYQSVMSQAPAGASIATAVQTAVTNTSNNVNAALNAASNAVTNLPGQIATSASTTVTTLAKYALIGVGVFLLVDQAAHKQGFI